MKECYRYTLQRCPECNHIIVMDIFKEEFYCLQCGLVQKTEITKELLE